MKKKLIPKILIFCIALIGCTAPTKSPASAKISLANHQSIIQGECTSICLDNGDHCVFGANQDNTLEIGLLVVNKRHVLKTTWDPNTTGEYVRWTSKYGSVTVNFVGYQMVWAGMNEAGLMISTMSVAETQAPLPDERLPFQGPYWMQYQLDNYSTVDQVIASDAEIRLVESAVDHYLVCDHTGVCAIIEFLDGKMVYHSGKSLPVTALTNSTYDISISAWKESQLKGGLPEENSLWRFTTAANRVRALEPSSTDAAITYAFDTLEIVSRNDTVWSFVYDPVNLMVHFRTKHNPRIRYLDFSSLDFSCHTPVRLLDVHAAFSGDISNKLVDYTHAISFAHSTSFFTYNNDFAMHPFLVDTLLWGFESFPCQDGDISTQAGLMRYRPLIPPTVGWTGITIFRRIGPFWISLVVLSLAYLVRRMQLYKSMSVGKQLVWVLLIIILGPFSLLTFMVVWRNKHSVPKDV